MSVLSSSWPDPRTARSGPVRETPRQSRIVRYNALHTAALCSPTRAALLSGRNHHDVGMAGITEGATGFPGYDSMWGQDSAAIGEVLRYRGYSTAAFGKWHNTPDWETSSAGPFDRWPTGKGFDMWYGFMGGETNQYYPQLYRNTTPVEPPKTPEQGYHLTADLADEAVGWMRKQTSVAPDKPWFVYFAPGAMHAPHHAPKVYIDRFKGKFAMGWDKYREMAFANQKRLGVVPPNGQLTPRPPEMPSWESRSADEKRLYERQMEAFAGFMAHTDEQIGRVLDAVAAGPNADNTLVILIAGDNGASAEGGLTGTLNNMATQNGFPDDVKTMAKHIDEIGGVKHENHFSAVWAWAVDTPFQWTKQVASHLGGTRTGMVVAWPSRIKEHGAIRPQFQHVVDIAPTLYDAIGIAAPDTVNGIRQKPLAGQSMLATFTDAQAAGRTTPQYFEILGNRAVYHQGWTAVARHGVPWVLMGKNGDFENDKWELYDLSKDFTQANDLAAQNPAKLKEMQALFDSEAKKNNVLPLDDRFAERANVSDRPSATRGKTSFIYYPGAVRIPEGSAPNIKARSHRITADVVVPKGGANGVIVAQGGSAGYSLFVKNGRVGYENNFFGKERTLLQASKPLPAGPARIEFEYVQESKKYGEGGSARILVNGKPVAHGRFAHVVPARYSATETFDIGEDTGEAVSAQYHGRFPFSGTIQSVRFDLRPSTHSAEVERQMRHAVRTVATAIE